MDLQVGGVDQNEVRRIVGLGFASALLAPAASSAWAFDCRRAASPSEKAICADPTALAADADLGKAFEATRAAAEVAWLGPIFRCRSDARTRYCAALTPGNATSTSVPCSLRLFMEKSA